MSFLFSDKIFYHVYALGLSGAPRQNDFFSPAGDFFEKLSSDLDRIKGLGCNAILIGPVFESTAHGYDTIDYFHIDRRLGNNESFKAFSRLCHEKGFSLVLDAVFNHTGRDFFAFKDIQQKQKESQYADWYENINFERKSEWGDSFDYNGWAGCKDLVKLNVKNPDVQSHLFAAVKMWITEFGIDGLRLDAADVLKKSFLDSLSNFSKGLKKDFWLMGEVVHGDYNDWANDGRLDSTTNYQIYKALWSSLNDQNLYELSYNLDREFNIEKGLYKDTALYNFVDNHDVNRAGSSLSFPESHLSLLYALLFTIPGIPSIYYGSELGIKGKRNDWDDYELRPSLPPFAPSLPDYARQNFDTSFLSSLISRYSKIRRENKALKSGNFSLAFTKNRQLGFWRKNDEEQILVIINSDFEKAWIQVEDAPFGECVDLISLRNFHSDNLKGLEVAPCTAMILKFTGK